MPSRPPRRSRMPRLPRSSRAQTALADMSRFTFTYRPTWEDRLYRWWVDHTYLLHSPDWLPGESEEAHAERLRLERLYVQRGAARDAQRFAPVDPQELAGSAALAARTEASGPMEPPSAFSEPLSAFTAFLAGMEPQMRQSDTAPMRPDGRPTRKEVNTRVNAIPRAHAPQTPQPPQLPQSQAGPVLAILLSSCTSQALGHLGVRMLTTLMEISGMRLLQPARAWSGGQGPTAAPCVLSLDALLHLMHGMEDDLIWDDAAVPVTPEARADVWELLLELARINVGGMVTLPAEAHQGEQHVQRDRGEQRRAPLVNIVDAGPEGDGTKRVTPVWVRLELPWGPWLWRTLA